MSIRTAKRGASARFLAVTASSTMLLAGLAGVALAGPASAVPDWMTVHITGGTKDMTATGSGEKNCEYFDPTKYDGWHFVITADQYQNENFVFSSGTVTGTTKVATPGVFHIYVSTTPGAVLDGSSSGSSVEVPSDDRDNGWFQLSHTCKYEGTPTGSLKVVKKWVGTGENEAAWDLADKLGTGDAGALTVTVGGSPTGQDWDAVKDGLPVDETVVVSEDKVPALDPADFPPGYTCWVVTGEGQPTYSDNNFTLVADTTTEVTVTNKVDCEEGTSLIVYKKWVGINGTASEQLAEKLGPENAGELRIEIDESMVEEPAWGELITDLNDGDWVWISEGQFPALDPEDFPSGYTCSVVDDREVIPSDNNDARVTSEKTFYPNFSDNDFPLGEGSNVVTVTNAVECSEVPPPPPPNNPPTTTTVTETPVTPVVEAATVAVPAEAPAAAAPAPATVAIPAKATLPAAVPAGDGSQAPGLPLWAVALMVASLLGAVGAFTGLRRSRN